MAAQQVELKLEDLWQIAQIVRFMNRQNADKLTQGSALKGILPVVVAGSIDAGGLFNTGQVALGSKSVPQLDIPDGQQYATYVDHARNLNVRANPYLDWVPTGRLVMEDRFANTISWVVVSGAAAYQTVRPYPGHVNTMRLTTGALLGNQASVSFGLFRLADAQGRGLGGTSSGDGPKIWYGILFKNTDANLAFIEIGMQLFDGARQMIARLRLAYPSGQLSVLNAAGGQTNIGTAVALSTAERWHWLGMELHYQSGSATLAYVRARVDDTATDLTPYTSAQNFGATAVSESLLEITVQNNAAVAEVCDIGYVQLKDLTNVKNLIG